MKGRSGTILMTFGAVALVMSTMGEATPALHLERLEERSDRTLPVEPAGRLAVTELVAVRPLEPLATFLDLNGYLPIGVPMLKRVLALPGQTVCRKGLTISVDGIDMGDALSRDSRGRPLPVWQGCRVVGADELFLMNWQSEELSGRPLLRACSCTLPSSARRCPCGPERSNRDRPYRKTCHSSVRSNAAPFLRPDQFRDGRRAQRRSRAAARPAQVRFTLDGREHDGRLPDSSGSNVHFHPCDDRVAVRRTGGC